MEEYTGEGIVVHKSTAIACRVKPEMYVGPLDSPHAVSRLLQEAMCMAMASAADGTTSKIQIVRHKDHSLTIRDDGPSEFDPRTRVAGRPLYDRFLTVIYAYRDIKWIRKESFFAGLFIATGLSAWLKLDITWEGQHWHQSYTKGEPDKAIEPVGPSAAPWRQISFLPDATIFPNIELHLPTFRLWFAKNSCDLGTCKVEWNDLLNNQRLDLRNS